MPWIRAREMISYFITTRAGVEIFRRGALPDTSISQRSYTVSKPDNLFIAAVACSEVFAASAFFFSSLVRFSYWIDSRCAAAATATVKSTAYCRADAVGRKEAGESGRAREVYCGCTNTDCFGPESGVPSDGRTDGRRAATSVHSV